MGVKKNSRNQKPTKPTLTARRNSSACQSGGDDFASQPSPQTRIWQVVALIPYGRVASYGQIAGLAGMPNQARMVGQTLRKLPAGSKLPWHRVVNAGLRISQKGGGYARQRARLEAEEVEFIGERVAPGCRWEP